MYLQCVKNSQAPLVLVLTWLQILDYFSLHSLDRRAHKFLRILWVPNEHQCFQTGLSGLYTWLSWSWADPQVEGEEGPTNSGNPACFTRQPEKQSKLLWLVIETESSLLIFFYVLHFRIVFLILFSYLHKRQHLGDGHIKKKGPKCSEIRYAFKKAFFFLDVEIHSWTETSWERKLDFLFALHSGMKQLK